ncbi:hypothetical protein DOY81_009663 [Sarcophaga bullata]|nr:hypothetical protein DOY81_009663 [Sarcophaga bullata]
MSNKYLQQFHKKFSTTIFISKICGADVLREDYRMTWITWSIITLINVAILLSFYSTYNAIYIAHDLVEVLKCLSMFGTGIQGYAKLITLFCKKNIFIIDLYTTYATKDFNYRTHLGESISLVKKLIKILWIITITAITAVIGVPVLYNFIYNERILIMSFYLPIIDLNTNFGFYSTTVVHVISVIFGGLGNMVSDCWCFVFVAHIALIKNILKCKFNQLDELLEVHPKDVNKSKSLILDIFKWHQKYIIFCTNIKILFFWVIFVQVATTFLSIVCTTVCIFMKVWPRPAAPVYLIYSFVLLYFFCALVTLLRIRYKILFHLLYNILVSINSFSFQNEDVITIIYDSNWYNLTVMEQKMIIIMLRAAQQAEGMSIGGVAPLSLNTALQLTKTFYTFSMMLRNFLD